MSLKSSDDVREQGSITTTTTIIKPPKISNSKNDEIIIIIFLKALEVFTMMTRSNERSIKNYGERKNR